MNTIIELIELLQNSKEFLKKNEHKLEAEGLNVWDITYTLHDLGGLITHLKTRKKNEECRKIING